MFQNETDVSERGCDNVQLAPDPDVAGARPLPEEPAELDQHDLPRLHRTPASVQSSE